MPRKRKLLNLSERCRLCLTENGEMRDLFTEPYCLKLKDLSDCTSIEIKCEQSLPKNICHACVYKLEMWNEFKERFIRSNRLLLTRLEVTDSAEQSTILTKRKYVDAQVTSDENNLNENTKKHKSNKSLSQITDTIFEDGNAKQINPSLLPVHTLQKSVDFDTSTNVEKEIENDVSSSSKPSFSPKYRQIARRGRTTERRKAYTRRWVARKKALIAATGNNSDTDSGATDNQLSPVQKARAKSNAEKEDEKQKKIARALKNLETNMNDYKKGSDSDAKRRLRSRRSILEHTSVENQKPVDKIKDKEKSITKKKEEVETETEKENISNRPHTVKSELKIGDTTYIVTSTLAVSEPVYSDKSIHDSIDQEKHENTDIIDAVQLKRINPVFNANKDKNILEKCLHIEVEGTEFEALQRVQVDLASFIEKDMKDKFFSDDEISKDIKEKFKGSYDNLDQQLKTIVVKAIKKNYETSVQKSDLEIEENNGKRQSISLEFVNAAMHSAVFQPNLILTRLDISKVLYKINNIHILQAKLDLIQCLQKKRTSFGSSEEDTFSDKDKPSYLENLKKEKPKTIIKQHVESVECDTTTHQELLDLNTSQSSQNENLETAKSESIFNTYQKQTIKHRCSICGRSFMDKKEAEEHMKYHRDSSLKTREKLMRCKRCHEIVAARYVKSHICSQQYKCNICGMSYNSEKAYISHIKSHGDSRTYTNKQIHKCTVCDKQFNSEMQLVDHLSVHDDLKCILKCNVCNIDFTSEQALVYHLETHDKSDSEKSSKSKNKNLLEKQQEINDMTSFERRVLNSKIDKKSTIDVPKANIFKKNEGYTCFVCDKKFSDEEVMKDHLQQHCDDMSEDEQSSKEHYQCAICSESLESEDALGTHVENHLFDDGDDNPNLINITEIGKPKEVKYCCEHCSEEFSSKAILAMHKEIHEEENTINEWEKQRNVMLDHACTICDEVFLNENDLAEHLDIHNESSHICLLCEKSFSTLSDLQIHVESH